MSIKVESGASVSLEEKAIGETDDVVTIEGYASTFGNVDLGDDVVMPGAFAESLKSIGLPKLLWQHKLDEPPIGDVLDAKEDGKGLWFKAEIPKDTGDPLVRRIVSGLKRKSIKTTSIGYKTARSERRKSDGARLLQKLKLYEISLVNMPMNPLAEISSVKGLVAYQDLPLARDAKSWDAAAALARVKARFGEDDDARRAFLFADPDSKAWNPALLIADVDASGNLVVNPVACFKAATVLLGSDVADLGIPDEADDAVRAHLDRYYAALNLDSPTKSLSAEEFDHLTEREREVRLKGIGISNSLAKRIASSGQWDADRKSRRDGAMPAEATELLTALSSIGRVAQSLIQR